MSEELQEQGTNMPQGVETPMTPDAPAAEAPATEAPAKAEPEKRGGEYDYVPAKFLKEDGTPDFEKLAKSYVHLEKKKGSAPPTSADDYQFDFGDVEVDQTALETFKAEALKAGFTKEQYQFMMERYTANLNNNAWTAERTEATLKEAWGPDFEQNTAAAQRAFQEYAPSDASPHDPIWNHPAVMALLARVGGEIGEDSMAGKSGGLAAPSLTQEEVAKIMQSADYRNGNRELHAKVTAWYQKNGR